MNQPDLQTAESATAVFQLSDLVAGSGVAALVGQRQIALFYLPDRITDGCEVLAIDNYDPLGQAYVLSRGIVGDVEGRVVVASPLYKQHYCLQTGECLEQPEVCVPVYPTEVAGEAVHVRVP